jgi:hypothetical protein
MTKKKVMPVCVLPIILTIVTGNYLDIAKARARRSRSQPPDWRDSYGRCPTRTGIPGNRAAFADSKDFRAPPRVASEADKVSTSGASPNLLGA